VSGSTEQRVSERQAGALRTWRLGSAQVAKAVGATVTFAVTMTGVIFGLWPTLKPQEHPATRGATLTNRTVDHISFGQYLDRIALSRSPYPPAQLKRPGALVSFDFNIKGYRNKALPLQWRLVDARTGDQVQRLRDLIVTPAASEDQNSWSIWIRVPRGRSRRFFVEVELLDDQTHPLTRIRTDRFRGA
jgi:hypothetical protein